MRTISQAAFLKIIYAIYDTHNKGYVKITSNITFWSSHKDAKTWKRFDAARKEAKCMNLGRVYPTGYAPAGHIPRSLVEVHEIDDNGNIIKIHQALPVYLGVVMDTSKSEVTSIFEIPV